MGEVLIIRGSLEFELRHAADRRISAEELKLTDLFELRALAQTTEDGAFRPLKSAPNLRKGWRALVTSPKDLGIALNHLYPGAVADWFALRQNPPPVTGYRAFTSRQTGMYRKTQLLNDDQASKVVKACCHSRFCLKRRLWDVGGLGSDRVEAKSIIPCLEPCALLLEFARTVASIEQAEQTKGPLPVTDASPLSGAPKATALQPIAPIREADFGAPANPRRLQWLLEKLEPSICSRSNPS
jgi:hypothetical protein